MTTVATDTSIESLSPEKAAGVSAATDLPIQASDSYVLPAGGTLTIPNAQILLSGLVLISLDGDESPGSAIVQIFRGGGTYNTAAVLSCLRNSSGAPRWVGGDTTQPATGEVRVWIGGSGTNAPLMIRSTVGWPRNLRVFSMKPN